VIAYRGGGYLETVIDGKTGVFFNEITEESLIGAVNKLRGATINTEDCIEQAKRFSKGEFIKMMDSLISRYF
jgi:glycosyltransferase involved in cell wall biosynthesis